MRSLWLFFLAAALWGQTHDLTYFQDGSTTLAGTWKFHPGDDRRWADPSFDDSDWNPVKVPLPLDRQGYPHFSGYGWYRLTLYYHPDKPAPNLRFALMGIGDAGAFFANGIPFGQFGEFPPKARSFLWRPMSFPIPGYYWQNRRLVLAVRLWADPKHAFLGESGFYPNEVAGFHAPAIGSPAVIQSLVDARKRDRELDLLPALLTSYAGLILAFYLFGLYLTESRRPEYLWLGLLFTGNALQLTIAWMARYTFLISGDAAMFFNDILVPLEAASLVLGIWPVFQTPVRRWLELLLGFCIIYQFIISGLIYSGPLAPYSFLRAIATPFVDWIVVAFLVYRAWTHAGELRWFALSFLPGRIVVLIHLAGHFIPGVGRLVNSDLFEMLFRTMDILSVVAIGFILMRRSGRFKAEGDRLHAEMEAARQVQRLMLPNRSAYAPHVQIETAYLPLQEVGGDFYQAATGRDGSLLLIIGDVSGKGLQAALTMSLIIGLWQEVVATAQSPREILNRFNDNLQHRLHGGFVTCLCARLQPDGQLTVANAGHLAPYLNGKELSADNGLPLGISAVSEYEESHYAMSLTDTLILISDGVVEARDPRRNFFGFERLQRVLISGPSADAIARSAQQFGQEDDITVIAVSRKLIETQPVHSPTITAQISRLIAP